MLTMIVAGDSRSKKTARGCARLQVLTVRHLGTFLADPLDVPWELVDHAAAQLGIDDPSVVKTYAEGTIRFEHQAEIATQYGYRDFTSHPAHFRFVRWLFLRAYYGGERPVVLFDQARLHLVEHAVLLPGVTTLERLVAEARERATRHLWRRTAGLVDAPTMVRLEALLAIPEGRRTGAGWINYAARPARPRSPAAPAPPGRGGTGPARVA